MLYSLIALISIHTCLHFTTRLYVTEIRIEVNMTHRMHHTTSENISMYDVNKIRIIFTQLAFITSGDEQGLRRIQS